MKATRGAGLEGRGRADAAGCTAATSALAFVSRGLANSSPRNDCQQTFRTFAGALDELGRPTLHHADSRYIALGAAALPSEHVGSTLQPESSRKPSPALARWVVILHSIVSNLPRCALPGA